MKRFFYRYRGFHLQLLLAAIFVIILSLGLSISIVSFASPPQVYAAPVGQAATPTVDVGLKLQADELKKEGNDLSQKGDYKTAIQKYRVALDLYNRANDLDGQARATYNLGLAYYNTNDLQQALDCLNRALPLLHALSDPAIRKIEASAMVNLGLLYQEPTFKDDQQTLSYYEQALPLLHAAGEIDGEIKILLGVGNIYDNLGQRSQALDYYNKAAELSHSAKDTEQEGIALMAAGAIYQLQGNYEKALTYYTKTIPLLQSSGVQSIKAGALRLAGDVSGNNGQLREALGYYEQALDTARAAKDQAKEASILDALGHFYNETVGDAERALVYFNDELMVWETLNRPLEQARTQVSIGFVFFNQSNMGKATESYNTAEPIFQTLGTPADMADLYDKRGSLAEAQGKWPEAADSLMQALPLYHSVGDTPSEMNILRKLATIYSVTGDKPKAQTYLDQVLPLLSKSELDDPIFRPTLLGSVGLAYLGLGDIVQARNYYSQSLQLATAAGNPSEQAIALDNIGLTYEMEGNLQQALDYYERSIAEGETLRTGALLEELTTGIAAQRANVYQRAALACAHLGQTTCAFDFSERARARTFLDQMNSGHVDFGAGADSDLLQQEQSLRSEIEAMNRTLLRGDPQSKRSLDETTRKALRDNLRAKQQGYELLLTKIKQSNPEYISSLRSASTLSLDAIQKLLASDTTLLSYFVTFNKTLAFAITQTNLQMVELDVSEEDLNSAILNLHRSPTNRSDKSTPGELRSLYSWLLSPSVKVLIRTQRVGIIPYGMLHYLPFAALTPDGQSYFGDEHSVFMLPSASVLQYFNQKRKQADGPALVLAYGPGQPPNFGVLTYANEEARQVASLYSTQPLTGDAATESAFRSRANEAGIIHLSAHGELNSESPLFSRVILAPDNSNDGLLEVREVYGLKLKNADVVVLSACQTQLGQLSRGDDLIGLSRAFMYAGAPSVVASLWNVNDRSASILMESFYKNLRGGMSKAEALRAAQNYARTNGGFPGVRDWAAFVLLGDPGSGAANPDQGAHPGPIIDFGGLAILLSAVAIIVAVAVFGFVKLRRRVLL